MNQNPTVQSQRGRTYWMALAALMTAVTCVLAPMSIPIGPVPISLTNLVIYFSLYLLGWKWGTVSYLVYVLIGMAGLPVFSGFTGGLGKLAGPTGGYIVGFLPMAVIAGRPSGGHGSGYRRVLRLRHRLVLPGREYPSHRRLEHVCLSLRPL